MDSWLDRLHTMTLAPRFGIHDMLEDRRLQVVAATPARRALLSRVLEMVGYEVVQVPAHRVDGVVTDGVARAAAEVPVIDAAEATDVAAFLAVLRRSLTLSPAQPSLN